MFYTCETSTDNSAFYFTKRNIFLGKKPIFPTHFKITKILGLLATKPIPNLKLKPILEFKLGTLVSSGTRYNPKHSSEMFPKKQDFLLLYPLKTLIRFSVTEDYFVKIKEHKIT